FGPLRVVSRITMRRAIGAIAAAALAVAVLTAGDMTVTDPLQVRPDAEEAHVPFILGRGLGDAAIVPLPPLVVLGVRLIPAGPARAGGAGAGRAGPGGAGGAGGAGPGRRGGGGAPAGAFLALLMATALPSPLYAMTGRAGGGGGRATPGHPPVWSLTGLAGSL